MQHELEAIRRALGRLIRLPAMKKGWCRCTGCNGSWPAGQPHTHSTDCEVGAAERAVEALDQIENARRLLHDLQQEDA